jgi:methionyl-tRNA formyltransferase
MRILFFGIYQIGLLSLIALRSLNLKIVGVITKPSTFDSSQPVADYARVYCIPWWHPENLSDPLFLASIRNLHTDLIVVSGYHKRIPESIIASPKLGCINVHGSLLPRYRGPCTWKWAVVNGETVSGVTVHRLTPRFDDGDILAQKRIEIHQSDTGSSLFNKISVIGSELLCEVVSSLSFYDRNAQPQESADASYFGYPTPADTRIRWDQPSHQIRNQIRGWNATPGAWTCFSQSPLRIFEADSLPGRSGNPPGKIIAIENGRIAVSTSTNDLLLTHIGLNQNPEQPSMEQLVASLGISEGLSFDL